MTVYIDTPLWPAHNTVFSHLISDSSLYELHTFAQLHGIHPRAFDLDHYDVPERLYDPLVSAGAQPVSGSQLVRVLSSSGLRIPARDRGERLAQALRIQWQRVGIASNALRDSLLERWAEPHRSYHTTSHLRHILRALDSITPAPSQALLLAAWFHDAIYTGSSPDDERESAHLAQGELLRLAERSLIEPAAATEVARLVEATATHSPSPRDIGGAMLSDADLAILASPWPAYLRYVDQIRQEHQELDDDTFRQGRLRALNHIAQLNPLFKTEIARTLWQDQARANLRREMTSLTAMM